MSKLTAVRVQNLDKPGRYGDGKGLWLQVRTRDKKSWLFRYTLAGRARQMGLGYAGKGGATLAEARDAADAARALLRKGIDPIGAKKEERRAAAAQVERTFSKVADAYIAAHKGAWRNAKHADQWRATLKAYVEPRLGAMAIAEIDTAAVLSVLEPIWSEKPETASRVRGRIEAVLQYAAARGWRSAENPARWRGHLSKLLASPAKIAPVVHHPALPWQEIGGFVAALRERSGTSARALEFVILTASRTSEVLLATWGEVDFATSMWSIPAARTKSNRLHRVPLSRRALEILSAMRGDREPAPVDFIFPAERPRRPLSNMALLALLGRMKRDDLTVHGFRATFRSWAAEATNYPREVAEAALAHVLEDKTEAAYQRGDLIAKRCQMMRDWADHCSRVATPATVHRLAGGGAVTA